MKRVLIVTPTLRSGGGVIRGLQNMLSLLPKNIYHIDVLPMGYSDSNNVELSNCKILSDNFWLTATTAVYNETKAYTRRCKLLIIKILLLFLSKIRCRTVFVDFLFKNIAKEYNGYDVVIAYQEGPCTKFVQYISSFHKIAWIHCDYKNYKKNNSINEEFIYSQYHHIVCVSQYTLNSFQNIYPKLKERSLYIHNLLDKTFIRRSAEVKQLDLKDKNRNNIQIISIGRLDSVKQFNLIPLIIKRMLDIGAKNFHWILVGSGIGTSVLDKINAELVNNNIDDKYFSYLGPKFNPYPYIKNSDILVSTSISEACPFVVNEARVLGVPVVSNNYPSIYEFIEDDIDGRIIPIDDIPQILTELVMDKYKLEKLKYGVKQRDYNNDHIMNRILKLLDNEPSV